MSTTMPNSTFSPEYDGFFPYNSSTSDEGFPRIIVVPDPNDLWYPWKSNPQFYPSVVTYLLTLLFGAVGNITVIILMAGERKASTTTNMFLVSLSVADLLMLVLCVPLEIITMFVVLWDQSAVCKMARYFMMLSFTASVLNLTALSLERFIVIVFPMRSRSLCTMSNCRKSVMLVWSASILLACPVIWVMETETYIFANEDNSIMLTAYYCKQMEGVHLYFLMYQLLVLFLVPAILMIVFYSYVIRELWRSTRSMQQLTNAHRSGVPMKTCKHSLMHKGGRKMCLRVHNGRGGDSAYNSSNSLYVPPFNAAARSPSPVLRLLGHKKKHKDKGDSVKRARKQVIKMLIVVVALFLLCWGPRIIIDILINLGLQSFNQFFYFSKQLFVLLPFVHCCINPIIYCFMSKNFRRSMRRLFRYPCMGRRCCYCCRRPERQRPPQIRMSRTSTGGCTKSVCISYSPESTTKHTCLDSVSVM
ncbi:unnamed protein product, partial [Meganyctiphanes norvegica]